MVLVSLLFHRQETAPCASSSLASSGSCSHLLSNFGLSSPTAGIRRRGGCVGIGISWWLLVVVAKNEQEHHHDHHYHCCGFAFTYSCYAINEIYEKSNGNTMAARLKPVVTVSLRSRFKSIPATCSTILAITE